MKTKDYSEDVLRDLRSALRNVESALQRNGDDLPVLKMAADQLRGAINFFESYQRRLGG